MPTTLLSTFVIFNQREHPGVVCWVFMPWWIKCRIINPLRGTWITLNFQLNKFSKVTNRFRETDTLIRRATMPTAKFLALWTGIWKERLQQQKESQTERSLIKG